MIHFTLGEYRAHKSFVIWCWMKTCKYDEGSRNNGLEIEFNRSIGYLRLPL